MRQYLYKAKLMITIYVMVSILFSLGGVAVYKNKMQITKSFSSLSDNYIIGAISQNEESGKTFSIEDFINIIKLNNYDFILAKEYMGVYGRAIYSTNPSLIKLHIIEGRNFIKQDFDNNTNTVIISDNIVNQCSKENNKLFYSYGSKKYRVIGIFKGEKYITANTVECYFNLNSINLKDDIYFGNFIFDSKEKSIEKFKNIEKNIKEIYSDTYLEFDKIGTKQAEKYISVMNNFEFMYGLLICTAILVLLNSFSTCRNWLEGKKKEIYIRRMVGAEKFQIYLWIILNYLLITGFSFIIGIFITKLFLNISSILPVAASVNLMFGEKLYWQGIIIGAVMMIFVGIITITITLRQYNKKEIIMNVRC